MDNLINRPELLTKIEESINFYPITSILGPRQCGKTTIARIIGTESDAVFYDLEDPVDYDNLSTAPKQILESYEKLVIIDEVQRLPTIYPILRVLADRLNNNTKFIILGSVSPNIVKSVSESLAGRVSFVDMHGFTLAEVGIDNLSRLWYRGSFPRSFIADSESHSHKWRNDFIRTFLERDLSQLGINIPSVAIRRFWTMVAHYHGNIWNAAEFSRSLGVSESTAKRYIDILEGTFMVRQLQPWFENIKKRQIKSPKIYITDSGILHSLLNISGEEILKHPKLGASWEGFVIEQIIRVLNAREAYFWSTHAGAELDLLIFKKGLRFGFEIKYADAPKITKSMHVAIEDLKLEKLFVIYPGKRSYEIDRRIKVLSVNNLLIELNQL